MTISSAEAMRLTGTDPTLFRNMMDRRHYLDVPPAGSGRMRYFDRDDLVSLAIFNQLIAFKVQPMFAARIASDVRGILRRRTHINVIYVVRGADETGKPVPVVVESVEDGAMELHTFRVAASRRQAEADMAHIIASREAS